MDRDELREKIASLEHGQWAHWTEYILSHLTPENIQRWKHQLLTSYEFLTEREKDSDRVWADKVLSILAPTLADAEKWRKLMSLFDTSCDKCFLGHVCGTHSRSEAVCEDIKDALEGEGEKG